MLKVIQEPLDPGKLFDEIRKQGSGSVLCHYALVKGHVGETLSKGILFERNGDIEAELAEISSDIINRWQIDDIVLVRRIGMLKTGEVISLVAVCAEASSDTFEACRYGLARLKKMTSLKKTEIVEESA